MQTITFISTVHEEIGKCDSSELCAILKKIRPEVIFLEALEGTYSSYHRQTFNNFGVYHRKLEIAAIQKFDEIFSAKYVPVLEKGLPDSFDKKYNILSKITQIERLVVNHNLIIEEKGFDYLNSKECSIQNEKIREAEKEFLKDNELEQSVKVGLDVYENTMIQNIYLYSRNNWFKKGVFMCGVAHRNSIINKIESFKNKEKINLNWQIYGT